MKNMRSISKSILAVVLLSFMVFLVVGCQSTVPQTPNTPAPIVTTIQDIPTPSTPEPEPNVTPPTNIVQNLGNLTTKELHIEAYNYGFRVINTVQINKGDRVKLFLTSAQGTHGFALPDFNVNIDSISPGQEKMVEFVADKSGTFEYFCTVPCGPGHSSMRARLVVMS